MTDSRNALGYRVDGDVAKLPKWAQSYVAVLERELADARANLAVQGDVSETNVTFMRPASTTDEFIPKGSRINIGLPSVVFPSKLFRIRIAVTREGFLDVNADSRIWVSPNAANSLTIGEYK
jgi:hypothetical protein